MSNKFYSSDSLFPPVPASYRARMEDVLESLPEQRVSLRPMSKKQILILAAALTLLLAAGTAVAVGVSVMQSVRDRAAQTVSSYQSIVMGESGAAAAVPGDEAVPSPYVTLSKFETDDNGNWQPDQIRDIAVSETVGALSIGLEHLYANPQNGHFTADLWIEAEHAQPYTLENLRLSINGGEPIPSINERAADQRPDLTPTPYPADEWFSETSDVLSPVFALSGNPLRPGTVFAFSGTLNGTPFTLTYDFSRETYEALKAEQLDTLNAIASVLSDIPSDPIPVNASMRGMFIEEVALSNHFLYVVWRYDTEYRSDPNAILGAAYDRYDDGINTTVDGMVTRNDFVSSSTDEDGRMHMIHRAYFPYDDELPSESLIGFEWTVFRVNWQTRAATAPKNEDEYLAWRKESADLAASDHETDYVAKPDQTCGAFRLTEMIYLNSSGNSELALIFETDEPVKKAQHGREKQPVVTVNGTEAVNATTYVQDANDFDGGSDKGGRRNSFWFFTPAYRTLPDTFAVTVTWQGETVSFSMRKSDFKAETVDWDSYKKILNL